MVRDGDGRRRQADREDQPSEPAAAARWPRQSCPRPVPRVGAGPAATGPSPRPPSGSRCSPSCRTGPATGSASNTPTPPSAASPAPRPAGSPPLQRLNRASTRRGTRKARRARRKRAADARRAPGGRLGLSDDDGRGDAVPDHDHPRGDADRQRLRRDAPHLHRRAADARRPRTCGRPCGAPRSGAGRATRWWSRPCQVQMPYTYFHGAPTFSEEARYHERIRLGWRPAGDGMTVEDPVTPDRAVVGDDHCTCASRRFDRMVQMDFSNDRTGSENGTQHHRAAGGRGGGAISRGQARLGGMLPAWPCWRAPACSGAAQTRAVAWPRRSPSCRTGPATGSARNQVITSISGIGGPRRTAKRAAERQRCCIAIWGNTRTVERRGPAPGRGGASARWAAARASAGASR